jgi:hypothetical protein
MLFNQPVRIASLLQFTRKRPLKPLPLLLSLFLCVLSAAPTGAQKRNLQDSTVPFSQAPYQIGERLTYNVTFANFLNAAHVELFTAGRGNFFGREGILLRAHVETTGVINAALYAINNDYAAYIGPANGQPYRVQQTLREGSSASETDVDYNAPAGTEAIPSKVRVGSFPGTYDFLSAVYRIRALPLTEGSTYYFVVRNDTERFNAELKVVGREMVKTNVGSFNAIATQIRTPENSRINDLQIRLYFSDDERHIPVLITARHKAGMIRAELAGSEIESMPPTQPVTGAPNPGPAGTNATSSTRPGPAEAANGLPFRIGEELNFTIYLGSDEKPVGQASFQVRARGKYFDNDGLMLTMDGRSNGSLPLVFSPKDQINSYVNPATLLPFRTELHALKGDRPVNQIITTDQDHGTATTDKGQRIEIPVGTHDILSVFYALRSFNLTPPRRVAVSLLLNDRPLTLSITAQGRQRIQLGGRDVPAIQLYMTTDYPQGDKLGLQVWVSDDRRRIPLRISADTAAGKLRADLAIIPLAQQ